MNRWVVNCNLGCCIISKADDCNQSRKIQAHIVQNIFPGNSRNLVLHTLHFFATFLWFWCFCSWIIWSHVSYTVFSTILVVKSKEWLLKVCEIHSEKFVQCACVRFVFRRAMLDCTFAHFLEQNGQKMLLFCLNEKLF